MKNPEKVAIDPCIKLLNEDIKDKELQKRYDSFKREYKELVEEHNKIIPDYNINKDKLSSINNCIIDNLKLNFAVTEQVKSFIECEKILKTYIAEIKRLNEEIVKSEKRLANLNSSSEAKFFYHWQNHKVHNLTTLSWLEWFNQYENIII